MTESRPVAVSTSDASPHRLLPFLLLLFVGSGCAALIYEIVWLQLLQLVIGSSAVSLGVLLGTFMGGMCLGSLLLPRLISARRHPLRVYAFLEFGIGIIGVCALYGMPYVDRFYLSIVGHGSGAILMRAVIGGICLLPPTLLMGATLPAIARWVQTTPRGVSWLGFFYGGNIAGAVFGCLLAGFYLLRVYDMAIATYVAVGINLLVATMALFIASKAPHELTETPRLENADDDQIGSRLAYLIIALSGLSGLGAEVIWTRLLSLTLGGTVYTFSIILAVFLIGLGCGSAIGSAIARSLKRPAMALGVCQVLLAAAIAWTACIICRSLPYWPIDPKYALDPWVTFQMDIMRCLWAVFPAALLWGASFPMALAAASSKAKDPGKLVGGVYAANTVGAIIGSLLFSIVLIRALGTRHAQQVLIGIAAGAGTLMLLFDLLDLAFAPKSRQNGTTIWWLITALGTFMACGFGAAMLVQTVIEVPRGLVAWGRNSATNNPDDPSVTYVGEGMNSTVAISEQGGAVNFHVSGKVEASNLPQDMKLQRMLGHVPALFHKNPKTVLVVGCGAGVTAGSFLVHPEVQRVVICEIEPLIPENISHKHFAKENYGVIHDPRVEIVYDDARHYVLTTQEKFDIITSDPIHPWVKGAATLYTKEYFDICRKHLNQGGIVGQWVPLYESKLDVVKSEVATFMEAFPNSTIWSNLDAGKGYDTIIIGQEEPFHLDLDAIQHRLDDNDHQRVVQSLMDVGVGSIEQLCETYTGQKSDLKKWLEDAQINRDQNLRLQYLAGLALNQQEGDEIYQSMLQYRRFPNEIFSGSESRMRSLETSLVQPPMAKGR
ncbi:MAG TPA: fused MFS/spermidine synthase [Humisphaera sp.]|nr:fused MFS/spermidine synthase [Humisphaera sp.]